MANLYPTLSHIIVNKWLMNTSYSSNRVTEKGTGKLADISIIIIKKKTTMKFMKRVKRRKNWFYSSPEKFLAYYFGEMVLKIYCGGKVHPRCIWVWNCQSAHVSCNLPQETFPVPLKLSFLIDWQQRCSYFILLKRLTTAMKYSILESSIIQSFTS